jgi:hypothetical protein
LKEWKQEAADWVVKHTLASGSREVCQDLVSEAFMFVMTSLVTVQGNQLTGGEG